MSDKVIKISESSYQILSQLSENTGKTIKELVEIAIQNYYGYGIKEQGEITEVRQCWIQLQYPSKCSKCQRELPVGEVAFWIRLKIRKDTGEVLTRSTIICHDCYLPDKTALSKVLKKKELEKAVRELNRQLNELLKEKERIENEIRTLRKIANALTILRSIFDLSNSFNSRDIKELYFKLKELITDFEKVVDDLETELKRREVRSEVSH